MKSKRNHSFVFLKLITLFLLAAFTACGFFRAPGKDSCDKILSREQMTEILTDVYFLEGYIRERRLHADELDDSVKVFYRTLFRKHGIEFKIFQEALDCYLLDRREMELIHEKILNELSIRESKAERLLKESE